MKGVSRTKRTIQNSRMSFLLFLIQIFFGFFSRKVFLDYLGAEVIGLNTTLGNILSFLNLAELGIGIAMATSLYKPIFDDDHEAINEILTVQGILYKRIAMLLCGMSAVVMLFLPYFFPNTECGLLYVYVAFLVFLSGSVASYLWNYRTVLIEADQKSFKLSPWMHGLRYVVMCLQMVCLMVLHWGIWGWLFWSFVGNVASVLIINWVLHREYPWLAKPEAKSKDLLKKYTGLLVKTKQVFVHKLGVFVLNQTSPLVIYAFVSLSMVTYYGNYMILIGYTSTLMNVIFEGMGASIGSLVAEDNKKHTMQVFWELFTARIWIAGLACFGMYLFVGPFIALWIGEQYILGESTLLLLVAGMFIRIARSVVDSFKNAYQLFADVWSPIAEAGINLGCSILFGYFWGLNGILLGVNTSLVLIVLLWKPYYTFREGFKTSSRKYFVQFAWHVLVLLACAVLTKLCVRQFMPETGNYFVLIPCLLVAFLLFLLMTYVVLYVSTSGMRMFTVRVRNLVSKSK